jgi:hypothetical protein
MDIIEIEALCLKLADNLAEASLQDEMRALAKDLAWARTKVYIRKPAGRERLVQIDEAARRLEAVLGKQAADGDQVSAAFEDLDEAVRRLRIEIARDTQTAT